MDSRLVQRAQHGDREAFAAVVLTVGDQLQSLAHRILRRSDLAEDATQYAFLAIWKGLPRLRDTERFEPWARRLLVRACQTEARRNRRWDPGSNLFDDDGPMWGSQSRLVANRDGLERAFSRLSIDERAAVALRYYLDLPIEAVAESLGVSVGTARSRLHHAVGALHAAVEGAGRPTLRQAVR